MSPSQLFVAATTTVAAAIIAVAAAAVAAAAAAVAVAYWCLRLFLLVFRRFALPLLLRLQCLYTANPKP